MVIVAGNGLGNPPLHFHRANNLGKVRMLSFSLPLWVDDRSNYVL